MTTVSVVLYYWVLMAATLLLARTAGLADHNSTIIAIIVIVTLLYAGAVLISRSKGRKIEQKQENGTVKKSSGPTGAKHEKNRGKKHK